MQNFKVTVNGRAYEVTVEETGVNESPAPVVEKAAEKPVVATSAPAPAPVGVAAANIESGDVPVNAPLGGTILSVKVKPGDQVKHGQVLLTLEALKMENEIVAPQAGTVKEILVSSGTSVNVGDILVTLRA